MLWHFYIAQYKDQKSWEKHVRKHVHEFLEEEGLSVPPVGSEVFYRDVNLTLLFSRKLRLIVFEPNDYVKKFVFFNEKNRWMLIALPEQDLVLTAFYLKSSSCPEEYYSIEKGYIEIPSETELEELRNGPKGQGYYRGPTEEEKELFYSLQDQCRYVGC